MYSCVWEREKAGGGSYESVNYVNIRIRWLLVIFLKCVKTGKLHKMTNVSVILVNIADMIACCHCSAQVRLPDVEFFVNLGDWPLEQRKPKDGAVPILSWCGSDSTYDIIMPTYDITEATLEMLGRWGTFARFMKYVDLPSQTWYIIHDGSAMIDKALKGKNSLKEISILLSAYGLLGRWWCSVWK